MDDDGETIWGSDGQTKTWPSIVLLCVACISTILSISTRWTSFSLTLVILLSYLKSVKWANRFAVAHGTLSISTALFLLVFWAISVGLFNIHDKSSTPDLWSWSCHHKDDTGNYPLSWGQFCTEQVKFLGFGWWLAWCSVCGLIGIAFEMLTLTTFLLMYIRRRSKREVRQFQQYSNILRVNSSPEEYPYRQPLSAASHNVTNEPGQWIYLPNRGSASKIPQTNAEELDLR